MNRSMMVMTTITTTRDNGYDDTLHRREQRAGERFSGIGESD